VESQKQIKGRKDRGKKEEIGEFLFSDLNKMEMTKGGFKNSHIALQVSS
jgi:hypothetical protein